ncbi:MAG: hypothetical protein LBC35_05410 [Coriobacteriales bacterium]|nr:hypothetical protein [Coriobacteriales bacterium]
MVFGALVLLDFLAMLLYDTFGIVGSFVYSHLTDTYIVFDAGFAQVVAWAVSPSMAVAAIACGIVGVWYANNPGKVRALCKVGYAFFGLSALPLLVDIVLSLTGRLSYDMLFPSLAFFAVGISIAAFYIIGAGLNSEQVS